MPSPLFANKLPGFYFVRHHGKSSNKISAVMKKTIQQGKNFKDRQNLDLKQIHSTTDSYMFNMKFGEDITTFSSASILMATWLYSSIQFLQMNDENERDCHVLNSKDQCISKKLNKRHNGNHDQWNKKTVFSHLSNTTYAHNPIQVLATSVRIDNHSDELDDDRNNITNKRNTSSFTENHPVDKEADFIVVGYGNAGKEAAKCLGKECPKASIIIIDPSQIPTNSSHTDAAFVSNNETFYSTPSGKREKISQFCHGSVVSLDHDKQTVTVLTNDHASSSPCPKIIRFKHSILIATGCRGSPPPSSLIDERAKQLILELRSTQFRNPPSIISDQTLDESVSNDQIINSSISKYPMLPSHTVQGLTLMAASQGARICILGSGIEALELAATAAISSPPSSNQSSTKENKKRNGERKNICLSFGNAAPLSNILPRYLSAAVSKRLQRFMDIEERSLVRYVSYHDASLRRTIKHNASINTPNLEIHLGKTFDSLDTKRVVSELLVVAPSISREAGSALLPSINWDGSSHDNLVSDTARSTSKTSVSTSFIPWSKLTLEDQTVISCFANDGRIVVNSELNAASKIYAAGSVAKYPNHHTGHATVAGEGVFNGGFSGKIAAMNMSREYHERQSKRSRDDLSRSSQGQKSRLFSNEESLPTWRTDKSSIQHNTFQQSSLSMMGIHALCIGQCDSENMSSHGYWWTNRRSRRNSRISREKKYENDSSVERQRQSSVPAAHLLSKSVYGSGVVFYFNRAGIIQGIMLWGLPFSTLPNGQDDSNDYNQELVKRMRQIILTNGEAIRNGHRDIEQYLDPNVVSHAHLLEESKYLVSIATQEYSKEFSHLKLSRPLHRYQPAKPVEIAALGTLKRNQRTGNGGIGDDIFYTKEETNGPLQETDHHLSFGMIPTISSSYETSGQNVALDDINARPPKEDPIWMRKNEAHKMLSVSNILADSFMFNMTRGQFNDGSDAVKQAAPPQVFEDARNKFREWGNSEPK